MIERCVKLEIVGKIKLDNVPRNAISKNVKL